MVVLLSKAFSSEAGTSSRWENASNLKPFAGVGVTYRHHEEAQTEGQHDDVQHELLLVAFVSVRNFCTFPGRRIAMVQYQLASDRVS
jgi:hypothetical protein